MSCNCAPSRRFAGGQTARAQAEYEADAHVVTILRRAGLDGKAIMTNTLTWLRQTAGSSKGGFFSTHPGSDDRIQKIQEVAMDPVHMPPIS
jgi:predicted Zn-dependent protease